eukprot:m.329764 g.329764  ORF g.329764 m.329764 type:complete len:75 (-) comp20450_c1_seq17:683-907(-)
MLQWTHTDPIPRPLPVNQGKSCLKLNVGHQWSNQTRTQCIFIAVIINDDVQRVLTGNAGHIEPRMHFAPLLSEE